MIEKTNNIVATAIKETFDKSGNNYLLGDWCKEISDSYVDQYKIKYINKHHWSDKAKWIKIEIILKLL